MESEVAYESLGLGFLNFIEILNSPFLISSTMSLPYLNLLVFNIFSLVDVKDSVIPHV